MKIYLIAYTRKNLGDDLFMSMLISKYPDINFDINIEKEYAQSLKKFHNVNILKWNKVDITKYDAIVYIGGSIFMEKKYSHLKLILFNKLIKYAKHNKVPFFYISCNFGPYKTQKYLEMAKHNFLNCEDICFRDKYSYEIFKEIENVRYVPDLIFSYKLKEKEIKRDTIGISVVDLGRKEDLKNKEYEYLQMLKNNINNYQKEGKMVYLFSFCKHEGDEDAIEKIADIVENKEKLNIVKYNGNIDEFLNIYSKMEYMICTRFHSMILSAKLKQKILVVSYSKKIDNVIEDIELPFGNISISNIEENTILDLSDFKKINEDNLKRNILDSEKQLQKLDNFINKKVENNKKIKGNISVRVGIIILSSLLNSKKARL